MKNLSIFKSLLIGAILLSNIPFIAAAKSEPTPRSVIKSMRQVADWQMKTPLRYKLYDWTNGALYTGLMAYGRLDHGSKTYKWLRAIGDSISWKTGPRDFMADDYCVGSTFCELYKLDGDVRKIQHFKSIGDQIVENPHTESLAWKNSVRMREWAWCDALFMGPPALMELYKVTGDKKYMDITSKLWWKTTDYLYSKTDSLYARDSTFFGKREKNGTLVYWSRGNGWVMGGLVRVLNLMPTDYPDYQRFVSLYKEMALKIANLQQADGTWHASLLDPNSYPIKETSGTGFYCYALAWGINNKILDAKTYKPVVMKAWKALLSCVQPDGKLGYVQRIGAAPDGVTANDTEVYGVGAFLLAGSEIYKMVK
ncbi:MAG TPA: glycoside hydrolase family 88 protein [Bacteroidales bacterium]|nr:glycoside hydrolase family 88 protein [Bacteroidales bacterium]